MVGRPVPLTRSRQGRRPRSSPLAVDASVLAAFARIYYHPVKSGRTSPNEAPTDQRHRV